MTTKVMIVVNGPSYVCNIEKKNPEGVVIETNTIRGGDNGQTFAEMYLGQDHTITVTETYSPKEG